MSQSYDSTKATCIKCMVSLKKSQDLRITMYKAGTIYEAKYNVVKEIKSKCKQCHVYPSLLDNNTHIMINGNILLMLKDKTKIEEFRKDHFGMDLIDQQKNGQLLFKSKTDDVLFFYNQLKNDTRIDWSYLDFISHVTLD